MKLEHSLTPYTKINSKWIKDLSVKPDSIKLLRENVRVSLHDFGHGFLDMIPKADQLKKN